MLEMNFDEHSGDLILSDQFQRILRDQTIDADQPGTILRDFEALLAFVGDEGLKTSGKHFLLPQGKLDQLNQLTSHPMPHRLKRPQQRSFPNLQGLYLLLRSSGLVVSAGAPPSGRLVLDQEMSPSWRELNATERYFALLESWLALATPDMLGERGSWSGRYYQSLTNVASWLRKRRTAEDKHRGGVFHLGTHLLTVALMEMFGWVKLEYDPPREGKGAKIVAVERLDYGDAMVNALHTFFFNYRWPVDGEESVSPGLLQPMFQTFFPEYQRALTAPETPFRDGTYTMRVSLLGAWRRIVAPANLSLERLAMTILDSVDFDADHLYCFQLRQRGGRAMRIACPYEQDAAYFADEVALGDLPWSEGSSMSMEFDHGDPWRFNIKLEKIGPPGAKRTKARVTARGGKAPKQYDSDDEDNDEDEDEE